MIDVYGKIGSLKDIRAMLDERGISRFHSIGDINAFLKNYNSEVRAVRREAEQQMLSRQEELMAEKTMLERQNKTAIYEVMHGCQGNIEAWNAQIDEQSRKEKRGVHGMLNVVTLSILKFRKWRLERSSTKTVNKLNTDLNQAIQRIDSRLHDYIMNSGDIVERRVAPVLEQLEFTKGVVEEMNPLIAGGRRGK